MMNEDELLERTIRAQERGLNSQATQPADGDLAELARLATAIRHLPHPNMQAEQVRLQRRALLAVVNRGARAGIAQPANPLSRQNNRQVPSPRPARSWMLIPAAAGMMLLVLVGVLALLGASLWFSGPRNSQVAVLEDVSGQVAVGAVDWSNPRPVSDGVQMQSGERLRTAAGSQASLVFFDGSRTTIGPNSDVTLSRVDGDWGKVLRVVMIQTTGRTDHQVVPMSQNKGYFLVFTPSGEVSVHGTRFNVAVDPHGNARFAVDQGRVLVTDPFSQVFLESGQATVSGPAEILEATGFQFTLQGELNGKRGQTWRVDGVNFLIRETTYFSEKFRAGDLVAVEGRILADGTWVADSIEGTTSDDTWLTFDGKLLQVSDDEWLVGGVAIPIDSATVLPAGAQVDTTARVSLTRLAGGGWQGTRVEILDDLVQEPSPTPTDTPEPGAEPELAFQPEELEEPVCQGSAELNGSLVNLAQEQDDIAEDVLLGYQITQVGAEYVDGVQLQPQNWEVIPSAGEVNFNIMVDLDDEGWDTAPVGTEVKIRVFVAHEKNRPDGHGELEVTLVKDCAETPTETPTETPVGTQTGTPIGTPASSPTPDPRRVVTLTPATNCTGANPHPTGQKLALRFGVPYSEIMGWFCQRFGFGEIDLAYDLSRQSGVPVTTIFDLRKSGLGWGEIKKLVWGLPTSTPTGTLEATPTETVTGTPSVTPTGTLTPEPSSTPEPTAQPSPTPGVRAKCSGGTPHPTGLTLSQRFGVPYEEIMGWFCAGFGFGEIDLAYDLSRQTGTPVAEIFNLRSSGLGWGVIRKQLLGENPGGIFEDDGNIDPESEKDQDRGPGNRPGTPGGGNGGGNGGNNGGGNGGENQDKDKGKKDK